MIVLSDYNRNILKSNRASSIIFVTILGQDRSLLYAATTHFQAIDIPTTLLFKGIAVKSLTGVPITVASHSADGSLIGLQAPKLATAVDREQYTLTVSDTALLSRAAEHAGLVGCTLKVTAIFTTDGTISLLPDNLLVVYSGRITGTTHKRNTVEHGETILTIVAGSPMYNLDQKSGIYFSAPKVRARLREDSCADRVYVSSRGFALHWGR